MLIRLTLLALAGVVAWSSACGERPIEVDEFNTLVVTLPDGFRVRAEVMTHPQDMMRGMMFRDSLPEGRGMLFIHGEPGFYPYWMFQVKVPLDIIWMDQNGVVVEIAPETPPCASTDPKECPNYGGNKKALMVLELPAGSAEKHGVRVGRRIEI